VVKAIINVDLSRPTRRDDHEEERKTQPVIRSCRIGWKLMIKNLSYRADEMDIWEATRRFGTIWSIHVLRREGRSRGLTVVTFDNWDAENRCRVEMNQKEICERTVRIEWERNLARINDRGERDGEYLIDMNEKERKSIVVNGTAEASKEIEELEFVTQEEVIARCIWFGGKYNKSNHGEWNMIEVTRLRTKRLDSARPMLLKITFKSVEEADWIYHRRRTDGVRHRVRRFTPIQNEKNRRNGKKNREKGQSIGNQKTRGTAVADEIRLARWFILGCEPVVFILLILALSAPV